MIDVNKQNENDFEGILQVSLTDLKD